MDNTEAAMKAASIMRRFQTKANEVVDKVDSVWTKTDRLLATGLEHAERFLDSLDNEIKKVEQQAKPAPAEGGGRDDKIKTIRQYLASHGETTSVWFSNPDSISDSRVDIAFALVDGLNKKNAATEERQERKGNLNSSFYNDPWF